MSRFGLGALAGLVGCLQAAAASNQTDQATASAPLPNARAEQVVEFWRTAQGLPHNTVNAVLQTREGYLWLGTGAGLARFDGLVFTVIGDEAAPGLKKAEVTALLEQRDGGLWVGTQDRGAFRLGPKGSGHFTTAQGLAGNAVTSLAQDAAGDIWIGTQTGLSRWHNGSLSVFSSPAMTRGDGIIALHAGRSGALWITTRSGVFQVKENQAVAFQSEESLQARSADFVGVHEDRSGNLWGFGNTFLLNLTQGRRFNYFRSLELASSRVWTICEQDDGVFWIGTSGRGLFRFQGERFEVAGVREGLDQCDVRSLYTDPSGNLWIGTSGNGLARLRTRRFRFIGVNEGLASQSVSAITSNGGEQFWVGTLDSGLWHWDGQRLAPFEGGPPLDRITQIQSLALDAQGALWVGTWGAGLVRVADNRQQRFGLAEGMSDDVVLAVAADARNNAVWAGTRDGALHRLRQEKVETFTPAQGPSGNAILCLLPREDGNVLVGDAGGNLWRWHGSGFAQVPLPPEVAGKPIRALLHDRKGRLWLGTWGAGAFCRKGEDWKRVSVREGLGSDAVGQVCQDDAGDFWFGTDEALYKVRVVDMETFLRGGSESVACLAGVPDEKLGQFRCSPGWPGAARAGKGGMWLATTSGILPVGADNTMLSEPAPPVLIEQALVDGRSLPFATDKPLRIGPKARSLDFVFTAVSFTAPQKIRFRHKLENFDADWVEGGLSRRAHYGPLPPGQYRFRVIAANSDGAWNETGAVQDFVVVPAFWRSWWFLLTTGMVATGGIYAAARVITVRRLQARLRIARQLHAMERERARIARDMHDEIGSKLTRISFLSEVARNPQTQGRTTEPIDAIASTSRELLHSLDEIVWAVNPRNDSLEQLAGYLEEYAREYFQSTPVECGIQLPAELPAVRLSAETRHNVFLALKEALNNVLKHAQATRVTIVMSLDTQCFEIRVSDNGQGFTPADQINSERNGLKNMQARLQAMGGRCVLNSQPGGGASVILRFPLEDVGEVD